MAKIKINKLPKGFKLENGKVIKSMNYGGMSGMGTANNYQDQQGYKSTLQPVPRDEANIEAEKGETVLTDFTGDGSYQMFNIGGKRHSEGGTPLNLPEQSFIYSDTRKMLLTKDEMAELGITGKKRITPAKASKKFEIRKYMDILMDEGSDDLAISTAESMVKKNKIKLSQLAFIQERKKNFEEGLPVAAYPYLIENNIDPREVEAQINKVSQTIDPFEGQAMGQQPMAGLGGGPDMSYGGNMGNTDSAMGTFNPVDNYSGVDGNFENNAAMGLEMRTPKLPTFSVTESKQNGGANTNKEAIMQTVVEATTPSIIPESMMKQYNSWRTKNRLKDIPEIQMMFLNTMQNQAPIMPGHSQNFTPIGPMPKGLQQIMPYQRTALQEFFDKLNMSGSIKKQMGGGMMEQPQGQEERMIQQMMLGIQQLAQRRAELVDDYQKNPDAYANPQTEEKLSMELSLIDTEIAALQQRVKEYENSQLLQQTTLSLSDFIPGMEQQQQPQNFPTQMPMAQDGLETKYSIQGNPADFVDPNEGAFPIRSMDYSIGVDEDDPYFKAKTSGMEASTNWMATIGEEEFKPVLDEWYKSYRDLVKANKGRKNSAGADLTVPEGYTDDELLSLFNEFNTQLHIIRATGEDVGNSGEHFDDIAEKLGLRKFTKDEKKVWQAMYTSLNETKKLPQFEDLFSNVSTSLTGKVRVDKKGKPIHRSSTGEPQSDTDGLIGYTSIDQAVGIQNPKKTTTVENRCPEKVVLQKTKECQEQGKVFNRATCDCMKRPGDFVTPKLPPYLTFPGDDDEVLFAAQTINNRDLLLPDRERFIPYLRDPGYVGPRQEIAAITSAVNAQADIGDNSFLVEGKAQEAIEKAINRSAQTNQKILANTQAYNIATLNKANELNAGFNNTYTDEVNTALQNFADTRLQDLENLKDAEITRRDNADRLYLENLQTANDFYYDPQRGGIVFQGNDGLKAFRNQGTQLKSFADIYAEIETNYPSYSAEEKRLLAKQMFENQGGISMSNQNYNRIVNDDSSDTETSRFGGQRYARGGSTRQRRLNESKLKMRNFLLGIS